MGCGQAIQAKAVTAETNEVSGAAAFETPGFEEASPNEPTAAAESTEPGPPPAPPPLLRPRPAFRPGDRPRGKHHLQFSACKDPNCCPPGADGAALEDTALSADTQFTFWLLPRRYILAQWDRPRDAVTALEPYQILRQKGVLVQHTIRLADALRGGCKNIAAASYTWTSADAPDPDGEKLRAHCLFLEKHPEAEFMFIDHQCIPQNYTDEATQQRVERTEAEQIYFDAMLKGGGINILYLSALVSAVMNADYGNRFWPCLEFYLSTRKFDPWHGFRPCEVRLRMSCVGSWAQSDMSSQFKDNLMFKNTAQVTALLEQSDIKVTNQRDKTLLLPKLRKLEADLLKVGPALGSVDDSESKERAQIQGLLERRLRGEAEDLSDADHIRLLRHGISRGYEEGVPLARERNVVAILGDTGCGKSTLLNYLSGCKLASRRDGPRRVFEVSQDSCVPERSPIGHGNISQTFLPQAVDLDRLVYVDMPGWGDVRGFAIDIASAANICSLMHSAASVRLLYLVSYHAIVARRGEGLIELARRLSRLLGGADQVRRHAGSIAVLVTGLHLYGDDGERIELEDVAALFSKAVGRPEEDAILGALRGRLLLYHPCDQGGGSWTQRSALRSKLADLAPIEDPRSTFRLAVSDSDLQDLQELVSRQTRSVVAALRAEFSAPRAEPVAARGGDGGAAAPGPAGFRESAEKLRLLSLLSSIESPTISRLLKDGMKSVDRCAQDVERQAQRYAIRGDLDRAAGLQEKLGEMEAAYGGIVPDIGGGAQELLRAIRRCRELEEERRDRRQLLERLHGREEGLKLEMERLGGKLRGCEESLARARSELLAAEQQGAEEAASSRREHDAELAALRGERSELQRLAARKRRELDDRLEGIARAARDRRAAVEREIREHSEEKASLEAGAAEIERELAKSAQQRAEAERLARLDEERKGELERKVQCRVTADAHCNGCQSCMGPNATPCNKPCPCGCGDTYCAARGSVRMLDGSSKPVAAVATHDKVSTPSGYAEVLCVVRSACRHGGHCRLVELQGGLLVTPGHPVKVKGEWRKPKEVGAVRTLPCEYVYNFVLSNDHVMIISGVEFVTLGHVVGPQRLHHPYYGSEQVLNDLRRQPGWDVGYVER